MLDKLPLNIRQWNAFLMKVSGEYRTVEAEILDFALDLAAIMTRESGGGIYLKPKGATGTGDWTPRQGRMPPDKQGYGRGLMQIDFNNTMLMKLVLANGLPAWKDPLENIRMGAHIYQTALNHYNHDKMLAFCAYNAGCNNVDKALAKHKDPNLYTTGNYGNSVLQCQEKYAQLCA